MKTITDDIEKNKKPRVHIKYEIETEDSTITKELPFIIGVMSDFSGNNCYNKKPLKDRKFINIDKYNFNDVMKGITPELHYRVENTILNDNTEIDVSLKFQSIDDFHPEKVIDQVQPLKKLFNIRNQLCELICKIDCSEELEIELEKIINNKEDLEFFSKKLGVKDE